MKLETGITNDALHLRRLMTSTWVFYLAIALQAICHPVLMCRHWRARKITLYTELCALRRNLDRLYPEDETW